MSNFAKWSSENMPNKPIYGVYFASRNKDNQDVPNFKERRKVFLSTRSVDELMPEFKHFVSQGQPGEFSQKWGKDTVKKDALLCTYWERKEK